MFRISRKVDYAIHLMASLSEQPMGKLKSTASLSKDLEIPLPYLHQIAHTLMQHGLLQAVPGPTGGLGLKKKSMDISIFDIIFAVEGDIKLAPCKDTAEPCPRENHCFTHPLWESMQDEMIQKLKLLSLYSLHPEI